MLTLATRTPAQAVAADTDLRRPKPTADQLAAFGKQLGKLFKHLDPTQCENQGEKYIPAFLEHATGPGFHPDTPVRYVNSKEKKVRIVYQVLQVKPFFTIGYNSSYINKATYIIPGDDLYLLGVLNSKIGWLLIGQYCPRIQNVYQLIDNYSKNGPILDASIERKAEIAALVQGIMDTKAARAADATADTAEAEAHVDALVAGLYGLTPAEAAVVGGSGAGAAPPAPAA